MKYMDFVGTDRGFQSSVNLQYDLNSESKIESYIPTRQSMDILNRYLNAVCNDNFNEDNATVLIGPYGRGKSHLLLILSAIISRGASAVSDECLTRLYDKLSAADHTASELTDILWSKKKPMLPVIINSNHRDINQSFIIALREALERFDLNDFIPETYYDAALKMIDTWKNEYENAFRIFKSELKKEKMKVSEIKNSLFQCSPQAYEVFCRIYPIVSNGAEFNPYQNTDTVKMYEKVTEALISQKNFGGIYIIFDEFSKYLESFAAINNMQNMKLVQDFAELAVRSNMIHFCCITHKEILDYSQSDSFRTVDGRFKKVYFVASSEQSYELVSHAIIHKDGFEDFYSQHEQDFLSTGQLCHLTGLFNELSDDVYHRIIVRDCFPLHPVSVFALIRISEAVGQNERTLFTFLSQEEEFSLSAFLRKVRNNDEFDLLTVEWIYDYFSELFRVETFHPKIFSIWSKTQSAIKRCTAPSQVRLVKILSVCLMINSDDFIASDINLKASANMNDNDFDRVMESLTSLHIITKRRDGTYSFLTPNGVDIKKSILNIIEQGLVKLNRPDLLQEAFSVSYIMPRQHNTKMCIVRYFKVVFMESSDFCKYSGNFSELKNNADGLLINIITDEQEQRELTIQHLTELSVDESIMICVSDEWKHDGLLKEYQAAKVLERQTTGLDDHFKEELQVYQYDLYKSIRDVSEQLYSASSPCTAFYTSKGMISDIEKPYHLNRALSLICDRLYARTPTINNEMVNKHKLTSQIRKARSKAINWLIAHPDDIPEMEGYGPEVSLLRSCIIVKNLHYRNRSEDENLNGVLEYLESLVEESEKKAVSFDRIFNVLCAAPYGMRKGVIPIFIAYVFRRVQESLILTYKGKEIVPDGDVLSRVEDDPEGFSFYTEKGTKEKDEYLDYVLASFADNKTEGIKNRCSSAVDALQKWFRALPKFTREHTKVYGKTELTNVEPAILRLKKQLIRYEINPHGFLFDELPACFGCSGDYEQTKQSLRDFADENDRFIDSVKDYLCEKIKNLLDSHISGSLSSVMRDWYASLPEDTLSHIFSREVNAFLHYMKENSSHDDREVIAGLAKAVTLLSIEDWNDGVVEVFLDKTAEYIHTVCTYRSREHQAENKGKIELSLNYEGNVYEKNLSEAEITGMAELAMNSIESELEDYGDSITPQEKVTLLLKLIRKELDQL